MVSHVKSKLGSVSGSTGEGAGELGPITAPVWEIVPDGTAQQGTLYEIPMTTWVTGRGLTGWLLAGNPAGVTIDSNGLVTILDTVAAQVLSMTCYVENEAGNATSNTFEWELEAVHIPEPPVWDVVPPQSTPDSNLPDQLDMRDFVTSFLPITAWTTTEGNITGEGILVIPAGTPVGVLSITVTAENEDGVAPSAPFDWEITLSGDEPEWGTVPDRAIEVDDLPYQEDMNDHIIGGAGLTGWALSGDPAGITIDGAGLMTMAMGTPIGEYTMTCFVENAFGSDISNTFTWSVIEIIPPVWDDIPEQENDDRDHPVDLDMTQFVSSDSPLTGWTTDVGSIDGVGLLTVPFSSIGTQEITVGVTNDGGTEETTFDWTTAPTLADIDTQPDSLVVDEPNGGSFTVLASHPTTNDLFYEWQFFRDGVGWRPWSELSDSSDGDQPTALVNSTVPEDANDIRCHVRAYTNDATAFITTDEVQLTVNPLGPPVWDEIPDDEIDIADMPYERDMSAFVTADPLVPITDYTTDVGAINSAGELIVFSSEGAGTHLITVFAINERGSVPGSFNLNITDDSFEGYQHDFNADLGGFTFTRNSPQTGIAADGKIYESQIDEPVFQGCVFSGGTWLPDPGFRGLLLEGSGENLVAEPVDFDTSGDYQTQNTTIELDVEPGPVDGFLAAHVVETTNTAQHELRLSNNVTPVAGTPTAQSIIVKDLGRPYQKNHDTDEVGSLISRFDLPNAVVTSLAAQGDHGHVDILEDGWRIIGVGKLQGRANTPTVMTNRYGFLEVIDGSDNYEGDGVSGSLIAGWQREYNPFPTSFMFSGPRVFAECRQALLDMVGQNPINNVAFRITFEMHSSPLVATSGNRVIFQISSGSTANLIEIVQLSQNNGPLIRVRSNGSNIFSSGTDLSAKERGDLVEFTVAKTAADGLVVYLDGDIIFDEPGLIQNFALPLTTATIGNNDNGNTSVSAYITVKSLTMIVGEASEIGPITITTQPDDLSVTEPAGGQFEFDYTFDAAGGVIDRLWEWSANGVDGWTNANNIMSDVSDHEELIMLVNSTVLADDGFVRAWATYRDHPEHLVITNVAELIVNTAPPVWDTQPDDEEFAEGSLPQNIPMAPHVTGADGGWQIDSSNNNLQINAGSGVVTAQPALPVGVHTATVTANNDGGSADSDEFTVTIISELVPPEWGPDIPNQTTEVLDMPATFDANDFVSSGELISAWSTLQGASSASGAGIISLPRRSVGSLNNDGVLATNSAGTTQSNTFNWIINPSEILDDDFDYANGPLEGNGPWIVIANRGDDVSHTVAGGGVEAQGLGVDVTDFAPDDGDYEFFATITVTPNEIVPGLEDNYIAGISTIVDGAVDEGVFFQALPNQVEWIDSVAGSGFVLNESTVAGDTFGIRRIGNNIECIKNGSVEGSFTAGSPTANAVAMIISVPLGNSPEMGYSNVTVNIIG